MSNNNEDNQFELPEELVNILEALLGSSAQPAIDQLRLTLRDSALPGRQAPEIDDLLLTQFRDAFESDYEYARDDGDGGDGGSQGDDGASDGDDGASDDVGSEAPPIINKDDLKEGEYIIDMDADFEATYAATLADFVADDPDGTYVGQDIGQIAADYAAEIAADFAAAGGDANKVFDDIDDIDDDIDDLDSIDGDLDSIGGDIDDIDDILDSIDGLDDILDSIDEMGGIAGLGGIDATDEADADPDAGGTNNANTGAAASADNTYGDTDCDLGDDNQVNGHVINWRFAANAAHRASVAAGAVPKVTKLQGDRVGDAFVLAELFLGQATNFSRGSLKVDALSATDWVASTMASWRKVATPMAIAMIAAVTELFQNQLERRGLTVLAANMISPIKIFKLITAAMLGGQLGSAIGQLSHEVFGYTDVGLPLGKPGSVALLPAAVERFAADVQLQEEEVRIYLAARESAHASLYASVPWVRDHLLAAIEKFCRGIAIDLEQLEESVQELDFSSTEAISSAIRSGVFAPRTSPEQEAALADLETTLALIEGWVEVVVSEALRQNLPHVGQVAEMMRRRRAEGGPAEHALLALVGLEMRPRRLRQAATLWRTITDRIGIAERDKLWRHPDLLPDSTDIDQPDGFFDRRAAQAQADAAIDAEIAAFFADQDRTSQPDDE